MTTLLVVDPVLYILNLVLFTSTFILVRAIRSNFQKFYRNPSVDVAQHNAI